MTIVEAQNLNIVLRWLLQDPGPAGVIPTAAESREAAAWLADRAWTALAAGLDGDDVSRRWHRSATTR